MKKFITIVSFALIASAVSAQEATAEGTVVSSRENTHFTELVSGELLAENTSLFGLKNKGPRKSKESGLYFLKPSGAMYYYTYEMPNSGNGRTTNTQLLVPDFKPYTYVNMSNEASTTQWLYAPDLNNTYIITEYEDENYNMTMKNKIGERLNIPVLWDYDGDNNFAICAGSSSMYMSRCSVPTYFAYSDYPTENYGQHYFGWLGFLAKYTEGGAMSAGTIFTNNTHVMGSGTYVGTLRGYDAEGNEVSAEGTYVGDAIYESLPAPISPIYVDYIYMRGVSTSDDPLPDGLELTMEIYDYYTQELLYTLVASTGDFTKWSTSSGSGVLKFTNIVDVDPRYGNITGPFVIDRAVSIKVSGFDQEGVDLGCVITPICDWDGEEELSEGYMTYKAVEGGEGIVTPAFYHYSSPYGFAMIFIALMDGVSVEPTLYYDNGKLVVEQYNENGEEVEGDFSIVRISDDGLVCTNDDVDEEYNLGGAYVRVVTDWDYNYNYRDNYTMVDAPDWITGMYQKAYDATLPNTYIVDFEAEPLPDGVDGREADIYIQGRGFTCETPIHVIQGNGTTGIKSVTQASEQEVATKGTYNLAGQRVSDSVKGILIKDGKKVVVK